MADYEPGKMDITEQQEMYEAMWAWFWRVSIIVAAILLLMYIFLA